eukprot:9109583-Lingulodinium_polyedra.AAC.1
MLWRAVEASTSHRRLQRSLSGMFRVGKQCRIGGPKRAPKTARVSFSCIGHERGPRAGHGRRAGPGRERRSAS